MEAFGHRLFYYKGIVKENDLANDNDFDSSDQQAQPSADLQALGDRLVGTWKLGGETEGSVTYEWLEGGFFLIQRLQFKQNGHDIRGLEVIGHLRPFGEEPGKEIRSRAYDSAGNTLDYVYELEGDVLTIWGGEKGSPSYFKGTFSNDGNTNNGEWVWPGGGYKSTMTRVSPGEES